MSGALYSPRMTGILFSVEGPGLPQVMIDHFWVRQGTPAALRTEKLRIIEIAIRRVLSRIATGYQSASFVAFCGGQSGAGADSKAQTSWFQ